MTLSWILNTFVAPSPARTENPSLSQPCSRLGSLREVRIGEHSSWGGLTTYMLSAVILSALGYPACPLVRRTGTPAVRPSRSSRTMEGSSQCSTAYTGYGPNCLTHVTPVFPKGMDYIFILLFLINRRGVGVLYPISSDGISRYFQFTL